MWMNCLTSIANCCLSSSYWRTYTLIVSLTFSLNLSFDLNPPSLVRSRTSFLGKECIKIGRLAVLLAKHNFFGDHVVVQFSLDGIVGEKHSTNKLTEMKCATPTAANIKSLYH